MGKGVVTESYRVTDRGVDGEWERFLEPSTVRTEVGQGYRLVGHSTMEVRTVLGGSKTVVNTDGIKSGDTQNLIEYSRVHHRGDNQNKEGVK